MYGLAKKFLFSLDAEMAHNLSMASLKLAGQWGLLPNKLAKLPENPVTIAGLTFPNRIGLAAGLDKNAECVDALAALGFGHIETGTLTPRSQPGNDTPRLFRLVNDQAIINRMGFNNHGIDEAIQRLEKRKTKAIVGVNIGKNKLTPNENAADDYRYCLMKAYNTADYITINISSPNTPGLRDLQRGSELELLLKTVSAARKEQEAAGKPRKPIFLKIAPDLADAQLCSIADTALDEGLDAIIATNTTITRSGLTASKQKVDGIGAGGLSGAPLTIRSRAVLKILVDHLDGHLPIISAGGIMDGEEARIRLDLGALLVQVYTGFVYNGPTFPGMLVNATSA